MELQPGQRRRSRRTKHPELPYGVYLRTRPNPYIVKFWVPAGKFHKTIGTYPTLADASDAAANYLRKNR